MIVKLFDFLGFIPKVAAREREAGITKAFHTKINTDVRAKEEQIAELMDTYIPLMFLKNWSKEVRKGKVCDCCTSSEKLTAHHLWPKSKFPELALEVDNGVVLCEKCHNEYHKHWVDVENTTPVTYQQFKDIHLSKKAHAAYTIHVHAYKNKLKQIKKNQPN